MGHKTRSQTIREGDPIPAWARYGVMICHQHTRPVRPDRDVIQVFSSRYACERWARTVSHEFPSRTGDDLTLWALVYAFPAHARGLMTWGAWSICYLSLDPGGVVLKYHAIPDDYGAQSADRTVSR
jgi:hypothetical protein